MPRICLHDFPHFDHTLADFSSAKSGAESSKLPSINRSGDFNGFGNQLGNRNMHSASARLKECSLMMSREYYRSKKSVKNIFDVSTQFIFRLPFSQAETCAHDF